MPEEAVLFLILYLRVGNGRLTLRTPVDDLGTLIDPSLFIQIDKDLLHGVGEPLVHGKPGAAPVAGGPQLLELLDDPVLILFFPGPGPLHESLPADLFFRQTLLSKLLHQLDLRGDAGMIRPRLPQHVVSRHALVTHQDILHGLIQGMTHMELPRHVRRRDHDRKVLLIRIFPRLKISVILPFGVESVFHLFRIILAGQFLIHPMPPLSHSRLPTAGILFPSLKQKGPAPLRAETAVPP